MSSSVSFNRRCRAITAKGKPCRAWAMQDSDLCVAHRCPVPDRAREDASPDEAVRQTHGFYARADKPLETIDDVITDALDKQARLSAILDTIPAPGGNTADVDGADLAKLLAIHGQNASRLGRLLRDKRALSGESADSLLTALGTALDEIATELGITL